MELKKPPLNEWARIVNSHFLQSPYEGKDWESVRKDLIKEGTELIDREVTAARKDEVTKACTVWEEQPTLPATYLIRRLAALNPTKEKAE